MSYEVAYRKIDARLRAYGLEQLSVRHEVAIAIVNTAQEAPGEQSLEVRASALFSARQLEIVRTIQDAHGVNEAQAILMMRQMDINKLWRTAMLEPQSLPALIESAQMTPLTTGPELTRSTLGAPQIDFGRIDETTESTLAVLNRWPKLRFAGFLCLLGGLTAFIVTTAR